MAKDTLLPYTIYITKETKKQIEKAAGGMRYVGDFMRKLVADGLKITENQVCRGPSCTCIKYEDK